MRNSTKSCVLKTFESHHSFQFHFECLQALVLDYFICILIVLLSTFILFSICTMPIPICECHWVARVQVSQRVHGNPLPLPLYSADAMTSMVSGALDKDCYLPQQLQKLCRILWGGSNESVIFNLLGVALEFLFLGIVPLFSFFFCVKIFFIYLSSMFGFFLLMMGIYSCSSWRILNDREYLSLDNFCNVLK